MSVIVVTLARLGYEALPLHEVRPYDADARYDPARVKTGYEVSFTRQFYRPQPVRTLDEVSADTVALERETEGLAREIAGSN